MILFLGELLSELVMVRKIHKEEPEAPKETRKQVKQIRNSKLLSFEDDDEEEDCIQGPVISFQEASGIVKKEELHSIEPKKKEENEWVQKMKAKLIERAKEAEKVKNETAEVKKVKEETKEEVKEEPVDPDSELKEKVKERIRAMKRHTHESTPESPEARVETFEQSVLSRSEYKRRRKHQEKEAAQRTKEVKVLKESEVDISCT